MKLILDSKEVQNILIEWATQMLPAEFNAAEAKFGYIPDVEISLVEKVGVDE